MCEVCSSPVPVRGLCTTCAARVTVCATETDNGRARRAAERAAERDRERYEEIERDAEHRAQFYFEQRVTGDRSPYEGRPIETERPQRSVTSGATRTRGDTVGTYVPRWAR